MPSAPRKKLHKKFHKRFGQFRQFCFNGYDIQKEKNRIIFHYSVDDQIFFDPVLHLDLSKMRSKEHIDAAVFALGMAEIPSFYKTVCTPKIHIAAGPLTPAQIKFWKKLYQSGLGEFFYTNNIDFRGLINITAKVSKTQKNKNRSEVSFPLTRTKTAIRENLKNKKQNGLPKAKNSHKSVPGHTFSSQPRHRYLVPVGGGKDSVVTAELLMSDSASKNQLNIPKKDITWFMLEPWEACKKVIKASKNPKAITIRRPPKEYFSKVLELNKQGFYNGHVPITAVYTFSAVLAARLHGFDRIVFSNERSANTGNVHFHGQEINHQYSKTFEFEKACHDYIQQYIDPNIDCFSLLRDKYEIQIAQQFARYPQYFSQFLSCNKGLKKSSNAPATSSTNHSNWCGECAKCTFVYAILSPFLEPKTLQKIFTKDLFNQPKLIPLFEELLGKKRIKPFDCVGIPQEVFLALYLAKQNFYQGTPAAKLPLIFKKFNVDEGKKHRSLLTAKTTKHLIPSDLQKGLKEAWSNATAPTKTGMARPKIAIVGFGTEGRALHDYLKKDHEVHIFDQQKPANEPHNFHRAPTSTFHIPAGFSAVYRSPGIPLRNIKIAVSATQKYTPPITSLTNLFFEKAKGTIIGVTGTKGKSTTASLIYHILKKAKRPVHLIGNIGKTGLSLLAKDNPNQIYVYELSSYQLETLQKSPHIAVVTNLYQDHVKEHGSLKAYHAAKGNISRHQTAKDILIISSQAPSSAFKTKGKRITVKTPSKNPQKNLKIALQGAHNQLNALLALNTAKALKIPQKTAITAIASFKPLPGRLQKIATRRGINFYEDGLATIPQAAQMAIEALPNVDTIILGGQDRGINFDPFARYLAKTGIKNFIIFPETGAKMTKYIPKNRVFPATSMDQAIRLAYKHTKTACLLAPASPSFNMFKDYKDRSKRYKEAITKLSAKLPLAKRR